MRLLSLGLYTLATTILALLDGPAVSMIAFTLCCVAGALIAKRALVEDARQRRELERVRISVVRWNW